MKYVAGELNKQRLHDVLSHNIEDCICVRAAVAYAHHNNLALFEECKRNHKPLVFYGRYDSKVPVTPEVLAWFLNENSPSLVCRLVPDILHSKVIWWEGCGAYIGSANLTDRAWVSNIEAGIFLSQDELEQNAIDVELQNFFDRAQELSHPLTQEVYDEQRRLNDERRATVEKENYRLEKEFSTKRKLARNSGLATVDRLAADVRRKVHFLKEWNETLELMRMIGGLVSANGNRPAWIAPEVPVGVQADQFLHCYYYQNVREGASQPYEKFYERNRTNPEAALTEAVAWWKGGDYPHDYEENTIYKWAPRIRALVSRGKLKSLTSEEVGELASMVHAMRDYASKQDNSVLGIPALHSQIDEKARAFGALLSRSHSKEGKTVSDTIEYVLYGGPASGLPDRLFDATHSPRWKIPRVGLSSLGELAGWAMPEKFPPRNARSSKALRALGNNVAIYI